MVDLLAHFKQASNREDLLKRARKALLEHLGCEDVLAFRFFPVRSCLLVIEAGPKLKGVEALTVTEADEEQRDILKVASINHALKKYGENASFSALSIADRLSPFAAALVVVDGQNESRLDSSASTTRDLQPFLSALEASWTLLSLKNDLKRVSQLDPELGVLSRLEFSKHLDRELSWMRENASRLGVLGLSIQIQHKLSRGRLLTFARVLIEFVKRRVRSFDHIAAALDQDAIHIFLQLRSHSVLVSERALAESAKALLIELSKWQVPMFSVLSSEPLTMNLKASAVVIPGEHKGHALEWDADSILAAVVAEMDLAQEKEIRVVPLV